MGALVDLSKPVDLSALAYRGRYEDKGMWRIGTPSHRSESEWRSTASALEDLYCDGAGARIRVPTPVFLASFSFSFSLCPCLPAWSDVAPSALSFLDVLNEGHDALA